MKIHSLGKGYVMMLKKDVKKFLFPAAVALMILCIVVGIFLARKYRPSKKVMPLTEYFQLGENQVQIILQDQLYDVRGIFSDGQVYVDMDTVKQHLNSRFYWDAKENLLLYTTPTAVISASTGSNDYYTNKSKASKDYPIVKVEGDIAYVALDYVKDYSAIDFMRYDDPNRVVINYRYNEKADYAKAEPKAKLRYEGSIKSDILVSLEEDEEVRVLKQADGKKDGTGDFHQVMSATGVIGYVHKKDLGKVYQSELTTDFQPEVYSHILKDNKVNLVWHQVTNQTANDGVLNLLNATKGVNVVAPTWFTVSGNKGEVTSLASDTYVSRAKSLGVEVWAVCNDFGKDSKIGKVLGQTTHRQKLEKNLIAEAIKFSLDGINIDFEFVKKENGEDFIQFIRELGIMCRNNGIVLSIDNYPPTEYSEYYNRAEQGAVADYVITMAYDEYYAGSQEAGPVSSLKYVQDATTNTLAQVPAEQTIIAMPFYSRLWKETTADGKTSVSSEAYSMSYAREALTGAGVEPAWDEATGMNYGEYKKDGAVYKMWLEDEQSLEEKLKAATSGNVAGVAFWKLGLEKSSVWDMIIKYTN